MNATQIASNLDKNSRRLTLTDIADVYGLQRLVSEPNRVSSFSSTMIDLIFTNSPTRVVCSGVSHISISDHSLIYVFRKLAVGLSINLIIIQLYSNLQKI